MGTCLSGGQSEKGRRLLDLSGRRERNQADFFESDTELVDPRSPSRLSGNRILQERGNSRVLPRTGRRKHEARNSGSRKGKGGQLLDLSHGRGHSKADFSGSGSDLGDSCRSGGQSEKGRQLLDLSGRRERNQADFFESDTELVDPRSPSRLSGNHILQERGNSRVLLRTGHRKHEAPNSGSRKGNGGRLFDLSHGREHSRADFSGSGSDLEDSCLSGGQAEKGRRLLDLSGRRERNQDDYSESDTELVDPRSPSRLSGNRILQERGSSHGLPKNGRRKQDAHNSGLRKGKGGRLFDLSYGRENNRADFSGPISDLGCSRRSGGQSEKDRRLLDLSSRRECNQVDFSESDTELVDPRSPSSLSEIRILKKRGRSQVLSKNGHGHQKKGVRFSESESEGRYPCRHSKPRVKEEAGQGESTKSVQKRHARDEIQIQELKGLLGEVKKAISREEQVRKY